MVALNTENTENSENIEKTGHSEQSEPSDDAEIFEFTLSEDAKYSKWQTFLAKIQFYTLLRVSSPKFWKQDTQSSLFYFHLAKNFHIPREIRISDWMENQVEPYFNRLLDQIEPEKFHECIASVNSMNILERIESKDPEILARIQRTHRNHQWDIMNALWTNFNPASLSIESINRQLLYGQRFLAKYFHMQGSMVWFHQIDQIPVELIPILKNSGVTKILLTMEQNLPPPYPLQFQWGSHENFKFYVQIIPILKSVRKALKFYADLPESFSSNSPLIVFYNNVSKNQGKLVTKRQILQKQILEHQGLIQTSSFDSTWEEKPSHNSHPSDVSETLNFPRSPGEHNTLSFVHSYHNLACNLFHATEMLSLFSGLLGSLHIQPELSELWKSLLRMQDHRIFTGQVITEIYRDICRDFQSLFSSLQSSQENSLMHIAHALKSTLKNDLYTLFNPLAWNRHGYFLIPARSFGHVLDPSDNPLLIQRVNNTHFIPNSEVQLGFTQIGEVEYLQNNEGKIHDLEELQGMNFTLNSEKMKSSLRSGHDQLIDYENQPLELLLVYLPSNAGLNPYSIVNISCVKAIPPPHRNYPYLEKTPDYYIFNNKQIYAKISRTTGLLEFLSDSPTSANTLGESGINYIIRRSNHGFQKYIGKQHSSVGDLLQKRNPLRVEIEEDGPLRFTFNSKFGPFADGTEIHTRYSFFHASSRICVQTIVNWLTPNAQLEIDIPFTSRIEQIEVKKSTGFSTDRIFHNTHPDVIDSTNLADPEEISVVNSELILLEKSHLTEKHNEPDFPSFLALYGQISHPIQISSHRVHFPLLRSTPVSPPDLKSATLDADHDHQYSYQEIGFHVFNWVLEPIFPPKSSIEIYQKSQEMRFPIIAVPTNAKHGHESFLQISPPHVEVLAIKEIEEYMREAPNWFYKPSMAEIPFVFRCKEMLGQNTDVEIRLHPKFEIKNVLEVDVLEHVLQPNIVPEVLNFQNNSVNFSLKAFQMKTIMFIAKIPLEEE